MAVQRVWLTNGPASNSLRAYTAGIDQRQFMPCPVPTES
jgi:hypothetical protein